MSEMTVAAFVVGFIIGGGVCSALVGGTFIILSYRQKRRDDIPHGGG